jgi:hypothetical protein
MNDSSYPLRVPLRPDQIERWRTPETLIGGPLPQVTWVDGAPPATETFAAALPPDLPFAVPLPPAARIVVSASRVDRLNQHAPPGPRTHAIVLRAAADLASILRFYDEAFPAPRWSRATRGAYLRMPNQERRVYCAGPGEPWVEVIVTDLAPDLAERPVVIQVVSARLGHCSDLPQPPTRTAEERRDWGRSIREGWPALPRPTIRDLGRWSSSDERGEGATELLWDGSTADLARLLQDELGEAGWTRTAGDVDGGFAWSRWRVPGTRGGVWEGVLYVMGEPDSRERVVHLRIGLPGYV